jgi:hypothetical protein
MKDGRMTGGGLDVNSAEYKEALVLLHKKIQEQSTEEKLAIKMTGLQLRVKKLTGTSSGTSQV